MSISGYTHVIWDWNGTLLDDVACCIEAINIMLDERRLPTLDSVDAYRRVFGFPVEQYYRRIGFDFETEPFTHVADEYIGLYGDLASQAPLFDDARRILEGIHAAGVRQIVLSASEVNNLVAQIEPFGIIPLFDEMLGLSDVLGASKIELGKQYMSRTKPGKALLVGDTIHDKQVADAMEIDCVLVANGHQSKQTLLSSGATVVDRLADVTSIGESGLPF